ncbi:MAG: ABC transporter ATP-binding protein [Thermofilaceae archaeon]
MNVEAFELGKKFGEIWGVKNVTLSVSNGSVAVLAGPNGAGKTTTTRILTTFFKPDKGWARVGGFDVTKEYREVRKIISYLPQGYGVSGDMTPEEFIISTLMTRGFSYSEAKKEARRWLEVLGLWDIRNRRAWVLSGGERRRTVVASALAVPATVYFLDEPTAGVDVEGRYATLKAVREVAANGATIFMTTHNLTEAQMVADEVFFINSGITITSGKPFFLVEALPYKFKAVVDKRNHLPEDIQYIDLGDKVVIYAKTRSELYNVVEELKTNIHEIREVDLEDAYLNAVRVK